MKFNRGQFTEEDYERAAEILAEEGIIFAGDKGFDCLHHGSVHLDNSRGFKRKVSSKSSTIRL
ncbi:hypothetical protein [Gottfriedia solisilvae]|uniref:hypothetical protein n=1 Tax=Gottfriedia solisilvae TaxID=1516104 RepID=UPI003D2F4DC3